MVETDPLLYNKSVSFLIADSVKIAFKATMDPNVAVIIPGSNERCFGPFNTNVPIPYGIVTLNDGMGYNPTLGRRHTHAHTHTSTDTHPHTLLSITVKANVKLTCAFTLQASSLPRVLVFTSSPSQSTHL